MSDDGDDFWEEDYELSERTKEVISDKASNRVEKVAKLSNDGEQSYVRFPTEVSKAMDLESKDAVKFVIHEYPPNSGKNDYVDIRLVDSDEG